MFASPGMLAKGKAGVVPPRDKHGLGGLAIANSAQTAIIHKLRPATFGTLTSLNRSASGGALWGPLLEGVFSSQRFLTL